MPDAGRLQSDPGQGDVGNLRQMNRTGLLACLAAMTAFALPGVAYAAKNGTYVGKDEGKVKVTLKIKNNRVTFFQGNPSGSCYGIGSTLVAFRFPSSARRKGTSAKIKSGGVFSAVFKGSPDVSLNDDRRVLTGTVKGNKVSGRMVVSGLCQADQKFTAVRK